MHKYEIVFKNRVLESGTTTEERPWFDTIEFGGVTYIPTTSIYQDKQKTLYIFVQPHKQQFNKNTR